jgi:hypothetical protein
MEAQIEVTESTVNVDAVMEGYIACALWASVDEEETPLDKLDTVVLDETRAVMRADVVKFITLVESTIPGGFGPWDSEQIGHDLWLSRNHHGTGFWDRGHGELGETLHKLAGTMGERWLYLGTGGEVFQG